MTAVVELICKSLESLKTFQENNTFSGNEGTISDIIKKIRDKYCNFNFQKQQREIVNSHLLSNENGIPGFLKGILLSKEFKDIKKECFKLLDDIIEQSGYLIQDYGSDILVICILYIKRDVGADLKKSSIITISKVLENCHGCQGEKRINIKNLIEDLMFQLSLRSKLTSTVKEEILSIMGIIAHYYPEDFIPYQERILSIFIQELKAQVNSKTKAFDYNIVAGCLQGLKEYLYNFSVLQSEDPEKSYFIFDVSRKMISKPERFANKTSSVIKAGLQLLASHALQFDLYVFENCVDLYHEIMPWVEHQNREMQKLGRDTVVSVLKVTSEMIAARFTDDRSYCTKVFKYFMKQFREIFLESESSKKIQIAVIAYGLFAKPCKLCLSENEVKLMLQNVIQKCEHVFLSDNTDLDSRILDLSCYLEALSSIISVTEYLSENVIISLEKLTVFQIDKFPKVPSRVHFIVPKVIIRIFLSVQPKRELFLNFLTQIVYQGLVKTCSHPIVAEAEDYKDKTSANGQQIQKEESSVKIVTYKDYMYLWKSILNVVQLKELNPLGIPLDQRQSLMEAVYDEIIRSSLVLISKLDLTLNQSLTKNEDDQNKEETSSDPLHGVHANNMTDYYIFINLVDFLRDLLNDSCTELFPKWVYIFGKEMIFHSTRHPYHSGFCKLISLTLSICSKIGYFKEFPHRTDIAIIKTDNISEEKWRSFQLFSKFVTEVAVRQQQFKDDLLASCLGVLLSLPIEIVLQQINVLIPCLESALKLGVSYLPLAMAAVSALERWSDNIPLDIMKPHFSRLLPYLNYYLLASTIQDDILALNAKIKKSNLKAAHKMSTKSAKRSNQSALDVVLEDPALLKIQQRIVNFLGRLGEHNVALLENAYEKLDEVAIAWDSHCRNHLKYSVPFQDMKPDIYFDDFLPRIMEIAIKSSVRQAKVAACEALHSLVLFMIGRGSLLPDDLQTKYSMEALYKKLFPGLLELACDVEQVTKQLFQPLIFQIIHWFTCNRVSKTPETSVILLCLWDGVTNNQNAALRDFSALCLREFFLWSIKQSPAAKQKQTENLLNKLHSFSLHPNAFKRIGAALTFNNIYRIFREQESLVKRFTIQLLVQFVDSLAIAHSDNASLGTQKQCIIALDHIQRVIATKQKVFLKAEESRKRPECLEEATLQCAVLWLLKQCGCIQIECRHKCMEMVEKLAPFIPDYKTASSYLLAYNNLGLNIFEDVFENVLKIFSNSGLHNQMTFKSICIWLEALQTSMDCYQWAFSKQFLLQNELHGEKYSSMLSSVKIYKFIEYYIENIVKESLPSFMSRSEQNQSELFTPEEIFKFNKLKCTVLVRLFTFVMSVFKPDAKWFNEQFVKTLWNSSLWEIIVLSAVDPSSLGFDVTDPEVALKLPLEVAAVIKKFSIKSDFRKFCLEFLKRKDKYNLLNFLPISLHSSSHNHMQIMQLLKGYEILITNGFEASEIFSDTHEMISNLLESVWNDSVETNVTSLKKKALPPVAFRLAETILSISYNLGLKVDELALRLLNTPGQSKDSNVLPGKGLFIFNIFADSICTFVAQTPDIFVKTLVNSLNKTGFTEISILLKFIDFVACTRVLRKNYGKDVIRAYLLYWNDIKKWWECHPDIDSKYSVLSIMTKMLLIDSDVAVNKTGFYSMSLFSTYIHLLKELSFHELSFINSALELLPFFIEDPVDTDTLKLCIEEIRAVYFPLQSTELQIGSSAYHTYISALKKLLSALSLTGCDFLLQFLTIFFCKENNHPLEDEFQRSIVRMIRRKDPCHHQKFADIIVKMLLLNSQKLDSEVILTVVDKVLLVILLNIDITPLINFFSSNIKALMNNIKENIALVTPAKDIFLAKKIVCYKLLELMYQNLSKDVLHTKDSQIVESFLGQKPNQGNELSSEIIKLSLEFKRISCEMEPEYKELLRKLNCAKYNTLMAVVSCTQNELKFYNAFLFKENPVKNERIWERIVDGENKPTFEMEIDPSISRKKKFVAIRHNIRNKSLENDAETDSSDVPSSLNLFGSEDLALSSLAEDVSKFVFSTNEPLFSHKKENIEEASNVKSRKSSFEKQYRDNYIVLEDDELNSHDSMGALCQLLQQMKTRGLIQEEQADSIPQWLNCIVQNLEDGMVPENVRLFLGRVIINNAEILQPYAKFLMDPLLDLIILGIAGFSLNYYILDIIITLLSWAPAAIPQGNGIQKANEVLKFLIRNCEHSRKEIFRNNLEVIKTLLECWKNGLEIPYSLIYEKMNDFTPESKKNVFGIQLLGVVLSCDFLPFNSQDMASAQSYFSVLLKNLSHKYKEVYGSAAEVVSLALKNVLKDEGDVVKNPFFIKVVQQLETLKNKEEEKFLYCLNKIHEFCPAVADKFIPRLLFLYPRVYSSFKNYILQVLCSRINDIENGYQELKVIGLFEDLEKREETAQRLLLQTLEKLIPDLSCDDILHVLPGIVNIHAQPSIANRLALYKILFLLFEKFSDNEGAKEKVITKYAQETLLLGLADPDATIRLTVDNFWSNEKRLPSGTKERLLALMKNMFSPVTEESFLQYATFLLLERTSVSPDFKRKVFDHPLSQCNFQAYQIQTSWRKRHLAMTPLFTESASSTFSSLMSLDSYTSSTYGQDAKIKATQQNLAFTETMEVDEDLRKQNTFNWLTGSADTFESQNFSFESGYGTSSSMSKSLLIANQNDTKLSERDFLRTMQTKKSDEKKERKSATLMLRRRFYKDKNNDSDSFARQELKRQDRRMELRKEQQNQRDAQVVMYRQYRIGELPDIEISNSEIIKPIQALAMNDGVVAKLLFKSLLVAVCNYVQKELPEYLETFNDEIATCFDKIFQNSYLYTPNVMSFCLETLNQVQGIKFDVETVFNACIGSNQQSVGILLLETKILKGFHSEPTQKKRRTNKHVLSEESNHWMKLAELYKSIESYDVVNGIFSLTMGEKEENKKALNFEISGQYFEAVQLYYKLYDNTSDEHDQAEKDFWDKSILFCMNKLSKWSDLETTVIGRFTNPDSPDLQAVWEDQYMKENYLPYLIRSKMKQLLAGKPDQSILTFFDQAREDEEKKIHLEAHYSEELALLYIVQDRLDIARQYSSTCLKRFLKEWQNLSPLAVEVQHACLQKLLKYVELDEFLDIMKKNKYINAPSMMSCLKTWQTRYPNTVDPVDIWDDVVANRHLYMKKLQKMADESETEIDQNDSCHIGSEELVDCDFKKFILDTSVVIKLKFAENCADQKNFAVAVSTLKSIYEVSKALDSSLWSKFIEAYCSINNRRVLSECEKNLNIVLQSWKQLGELGKRCGPSVSQTRLLSHTLEILALMFMKDEITVRDLTDKQKEMISVISEGKINKTEIISEMLDKSFLCLKNVIKAPGEFTEQKYESDSSKKGIASAHMELANFCNRYLLDEPVHGFPPCNIPSFSEFSHVLTESLLNALKFGSKDSLLLFPRLLQVIDTYPSCLPLFQKKTSEMPCWLFIGWIDQMLAILDKPEGKAVHTIIENIASAYPDAIIYAFHLSYNSYDFTKLKDGQINQNFVEKIKSILEKQTLISDFVAALEHLSVPYVIFKEYVAEIEGLINSNAATDKIKNCFTKMMNMLFFDKTESASRRIPIGPVQKKFAEEFRPKVLDICGMNGTKLLGKSGTQAALKALRGLIGTAKNHHEKVTSLEKISPWLSEFKQWKYTSQIEIPGQYSGKSKPLPEYHVKVAGFDEKVLVLKSITVPQRITIRGNDEKEYKILVKSGEDLRQDVRIQQLFSVMNYIYSSDVLCSTRHLSLRTYKVVPLNNRFGLIEWVDNTTVLQDFLNDGMSEEERKKFYGSSDGSLVQRKFLQWEKSTQNAFFLYPILYQKKSRKECVEKFQELVNLVPKNLLVKSFLKLSSSPEAFMVLRTKYAQSHAVICLSQWIIGIGDRHLGNFLIDKSSGCEVGIDFGHAFGSATQFLHVPELVPFRLTPQYLQLMGPLGVKGIYESTMIHTLSALCNKRDILLSVMDIFIKEPTINWEANANKQLQDLRMSSEGKKENWFPKQRIAIARKKLEGVNPCYVTRKELELGHSSKGEIFKRMESVCLGNSEFNIRARMKKAGLTVEEQVDCLIDLATDPHVLCLIYYGWNPWF